MPANGNGDVIGHRRWRMLGSAYQTKQRVLLKLLARLSKGLAGIVREVRGSTRGTPLPRLWFLGFVERQAPRCYRVEVLG